MQNNIKLKQEVEFAETVYEGNHIDILNQIRFPNCAVSIYHRQLDTKLLNWLDSLTPEQLPELRLTLHINEIKDAIMEVCRSHGILDKKECMALAQDITSLSKSFAKQMNVNKVNLRLDVVDNNACRKFHQDYVTARLICTYRGLGTEYGLCLTEDNMLDINKTPRGSAAIFKGRQWQNGAPSAIYHRSPQIEGSGETRLLLVIDPYSEASNCDCC